MKLKYAYGIVPGNSSGVKEAGCRDQSGILEQNGVTVISLSGTAEEKVNTDLCAKTTAHVATEFVASHFDKLYSAQVNTVKKAILGWMKDDLRKKETAQFCSDCPFMFIAVKGNRYLAVHSGGGLIARHNEGVNEEGFSVLSGPEPENRDALRVDKGELQEPFGFLLLSDGACQSLYESGTGSLSPACGTFFEWLKEYDGETVSEALRDNIGKYFLKDTKGDISVVLMLSEHSETEPAAEATEAEANESAVVAPEAKANEPAAIDGGSGKHRKIIKYLALLLIVLVVIYAFALKQFDNAEKDDPGNAETKPPVFYSENNYEPSVTFSVANPEAYDPGEYKAGVDIPAGEYFFWTGEMLKPNSIFVNDDTCLSGELYCMTIQLNDWDTLVSEYRFTAAENVNPVEPTEGILWSGKYKIGKDIKPGTYTVSPVERDTEARYYSLLDEQINNDIKFSEDTTVTVPEEGYIVFYRSVLFVEND